MNKIKVFLPDGTEQGTKALNPDLFEQKINEDLMHRSVIMRLSNARQNIAHTKTRAEVRGGGRKPWRQKGTGRARAGSIRGPIWRGGGVSFGPRNNRNFVKNMPKKERRMAIFSALSLKLKNKSIYSLASYDNQEIKTKTFAQMLDKLPTARKTLFVLGEKNEVFLKSSRNIPNVKVLPVNFLNVYDLLNYEKVCFVADADKKAEEIFLSKKK